MKYPLIALVTLLAGCAAPAPLDVSSREPACARRCLEIHSQCASTAGIAAHPVVAGDVLRACRENAENCLSTCPAK